MGRRSLTAVAVGTGLVALVAASRASARVAAATCPLEGSWTQSTPGSGPSTWRISAAGAATEEGLGNATGTAQLAGNTLRITWVTGTWRGYYQWTLDDSCSGSGKLVFTAGPRAGKSFASTVDGPEPAAPAQGAGAATAATATGDVQIVRADGSVVTARPGLALGAGDRVVTGMESSFSFRLPDGSSVTVGELADVRVGDTGKGAEAVRTRLWLTAGQVSAEVTPVHAARSDFEVRMPTATASVRGTIFSTYYDRGAGIAIVSVRRGAVAVAPASGRAVLVKAGTEVEVKRSGVGPVVALGTAGAAGGVNRVSAVARALAEVVRLAPGCKGTAASATTARVSGRAWIVSVRLTGKLAGWSRWKVARTGVAPADAAAQALARGC